MRHIPSAPCEFDILPTTRHRQHYNCIIGMLCIIQKLLVLQYGCIDMDGMCFGEKHIPGGMGCTFYNLYGLELDNVVGPTRTVSFCDTVHR